jgi:hypothetical protein
MDVTLGHSTDVALAYADRLAENLHTMQKVHGEEEHKWLERVIAKSAVEDQRFQVRHFDFRRMQCMEDDG